MCKYVECLDLKTKEQWPYNNTSIAKLINLFKCLDLKIKGLIKEMSVGRSSHMPLLYHKPNSTRVIVIHQVTKSKLNYL